MDSSEAARVFLAENTLLHMNMLEILRRGSGDILYAGPDGVLLRDRQSGAYFMASAGAESDGRLLDLLPGDTGLFVGHHLRYKGEAARRFRLREEQICYQAAWMRPELPVVPEISGVLRLLDRSHAAYVYEHYSHPFGGVAYVEKVIERGMVGAFVDGVLAGFAGFHDEGSGGAGPRCGDPGFSGSLRGGIPAPGAGRGPALRRCPIGPGAGTVCVRTGFY